MAYFSGDEQQKTDVCFGISSGLDECFPLDVGMRRGCPWLNSSGLDFSGLFEESNDCPRLLTKVRDRLRVARVGGEQFKMVRLIGK
ncbi:hypothetical protein CASFOL_042511 [Castilleja foliolosa]|uniref:Uncharacterized protein n=1 Tax=Castilleja foliolosa TaxID=1961234 RepID=A0ABD3BAY5_9LAMI